MCIGSGVTHLRDPDALVCALTSVGAGVNGRESVSVYLRNNSSGTFSMILKERGVLLGVLIICNSARIAAISSANNNGLPSIAFNIYKKKFKETVVIVNI